MLYILYTLEETCGRLLLAIRMLLQEAATQHVILGHKSSPGHVVRGGARFGAFESRFEG